MATAATSGERALASRRDRKELSVLCQHDAMAPLLLADSVRSRCRRLLPFHWAHGTIEKSEQPEGPLASGCWDEIGQQSAQLAEIVVAVSPRQKQLCAAEIAELQFNEPGRDFSGAGFRRRFQPHRFASARLPLYCGWRRIGRFAISRQLAPAFLSFRPAQRNLPTGPRATPTIGQSRPPSAYQHDATTTTDFHAQPVRPSTTFAPRFFLFPVSKKKKTSYALRIITNPINQSPGSFSLTWKQKL